MPNDLRTFSVEIPVNDSEKMEAFQQAMDAMHDATNDYIANLAKELNIPMSCAQDVWYLRTRSRWTEAYEKALIELHRKGNPPNVFDWP